MIKIEDEPEEPEKKDPLVQSASKRKGREKVQGSPKRARFSTDPTEYALTRASEAELLFGRLRFILPATPVTQVVSAKPSLPDSSTSVAPITVEPLGRSPTGDAETIVGPEAGLVFGDKPQAETGTSPELGYDFGTRDRVEMEPPSAKGLEEPQPEVQNPRPSCGEASTSRPGALITSLRKGLLACPLEALLEILPEESSSMAGTESSGELAEALLHTQLQVSLMR